MDPYFGKSDAELRQIALDRYGFGFRPEDSKEAIAATLRQEDLKHAGSKIANETQLNRMFGGPALPFTSGNLGILIDIRNRRDTPSINPKATFQNKRQRVVPPPSFTPSIITPAIVPPSFVPAIVTPAIVPPSFVPAIITPPIITTPAIITPPIITPPIITPAIVPSRVVSPPVILPPSTITIPVPGLRVITPPAIAGGVPGLIVPRVTTPIPIPAVRINIPANPNSIPPTIPVGGHIPLSSPAPIIIPISGNYAQSGDLTSVQEVTPFAPGYVPGIRYNGVVSLRPELTLAPPNFNPRQQQGLMSSTFPIGTIRFPEETITRLAPVDAHPKPIAPANVEAMGIRQAPLPGSDQARAVLLASIARDRLQDKRGGAQNGLYKLAQIKQFARQLGLPATGNKGQLVRDILALYDD